MNDTTLSEIFNSLSAWEIRNARVWLESPCHNRRAEPLRLFDYLAQCRATGVAPEFPQALEAVFGNLEKSPPPKPSKAQNRKSQNPKPQNLETQKPKLRHEMSALSELLREFLIWQEMRESGHQRELMLLRALRKRGLEKNFHFAVRELENAFETTENQSFAKYLDEFRLGMEKYEWDLRTRRGEDFPLEKLREKLDAWFAGQVLHLACMSQARQAMHREKRDMPAVPESLDELLDNLQGRPHESQPGVLLYRLGQQMLAAPENGERMEQFRQLLENQINNVPRSESRDLLMLAINHGVRRINAGDRSAIRRILDFYLFGLEQKLLHDESGLLSKFTYQNVLSTFLALEEWDKATAFLEKYRPELAENERENTHRYNLAVCLFRQGNFDGTLELLRDVSFADPIYNLESRKMLLKIYFESGAFDALESLLENLLNWLRRHGELGYHREMYRNLAVFTGRLLRLPPSDKEARKRLKKKVLDTPLVAERNWLLEKINARMS